MDTRLGVRISRGFESCSLRRSGRPSSRVSVSPLDWVPSFDFVGIPVYLLFGFLFKATSILFGILAHFIPLTIGFVSLFSNFIEMY